MCYYLFNISNLLVYFCAFSDMLGQMGDHPRLEELVSCPTSLSYYIGSNMPIQDHTRQELLEIDSTLARLKREIQLLEGMDTLRCNYCGVSFLRLIYILSLFQWGSACPAI